MLFPYTAISLAPYGVVLLAILMVSAGLSIDWSLTARIRARAADVLVGILSSFIVLPVAVWLLARLVVDDQQYLYGVVFASLCPIALVAPFFTKLHDGDTELAVLLVIASMIVCPVLAPLALVVMFPGSASLDLLPLARYTLLLVTAPLAFSILVARTWPALRSGFIRIEAPLNSITLALLVFILFGAATGRINTSYLDVSEVAVLLGLAFVQDFGVLLAARFVFSGMSSAGALRALALSVSMKNVAVAAGILLVYDPKASLAPALGFVAHAFLFSVLAVPTLFRRLWR